MIGAHEKHYDTCPDCVQFERKRIIALLEAEIESPVDTYVPDEFDFVDWYDGYIMGIRDAITLIKGESAQTSI